MTASKPLISRIDWDSVDAKTASDQSKRESHAPWIGVYRWWARRPPSVVGALLDGGRSLFGEGFLVSDMFSGGGTVGFEAAARSLPVYAQDLYPWPATGLATGLTHISLGEFNRAAAELLDSLAALRRAYYQRAGVELSHVIRVRRAPCPQCDHCLYLFRRPLVSMRSRSPGEQHGFLGCVSCGRVSLRRVPVSRFTCDHCSVTSRQEPAPVRGRPRICCPRCKGVFPLSDLLASLPQWEPVLVQTVEGAGKSKPKVTIRPPEPGDPILDDPVRPRIATLNSPIPSGVETDCLHRDGFRRWSDLYTNRQLRILSAALDQIRQSPASPAVRERLRVAVIGGCEMAACLSRWEPHYPKAFEAMANHRFARITVSVETNLLSKIGRGTLPRRIDAAQKAIAWWGQVQSTPKVSLVAASGRRRSHRGGVLIAVGSSRRQLLRDNQVDLLLTDPPYHDDVQYGELASLFHAWLCCDGSKFVVSQSEEVAPNKYQNGGTDWYRDTVADCLSEGRRTLTARGRLILTYHNNSLTAWMALGQAISQAGFQIVAIAAVVAENPADHCKRGRHVFFHDLVVECRPAGLKSNPSSPELVGRHDSIERRNLIAVGFALSRIASCESRDCFKQQYHRELARLGGGAAWIT